MSLRTLPLVSIANVRFKGSSDWRSKTEICCGLPSSVSAKSSRVRPAAIAPFWSITFTKTLTSFTSTCRVSSCAASVRGARASSAQKQVRRQLFITPMERVRACIPKEYRLQVRRGRRQSVNSELPGYLVQSAKRLRLLAGVPSTGWMQESRSVAIDGGLRPFLFQDVAYQFVVFFRRFPNEVISMILLIVSRIWRTRRIIAVGTLAI